MTLDGTSVQCNDLTDEKTGDLFDMRSSLLNRCGRFYDALSKEVQRQSRHSSDPEATLKWIGFTAEFAWKTGVGRYADGTIENAAFKIGELLDRFPNAIRSNEWENVGRAIPHSTRLKVLHVATTIYVTGGHGRLLNNFVRNDPNTCHSLIVTNQGSTPFPTWLEETISRNGGVVIQFPSNAPALSKAKWLRAAARSSVDAVILHHHPNDAIPIIALTAQDCPPTAVMNHADHVFWLGSSVADVVVNIRQSGLNLSKTRRLSRHNCLLPIPLSAASETLTKEEARRKLGIPNDQFMLLSIGSAYKYQATETHDFFRSSARILSNYPKANLYIIGVEKKHLANSHAAHHERLHLLGEIEDVRAFYSAADLYLEGFPFGSLTALLDAVAAGVCSVLSLMPPSAVLATDDIALDGILEHSKTEDEYVALVGTLVENKEQRESIVARLKDRVLAYHCRDQWGTHLKDLYHFLTSCPHAPAPISKGCFMTTPDDIAWNALAARNCHEVILAQHLAIQHFRVLALNDLFKLLAISIYTGDTPLAYRPLRSWPWIFKKKLFTENVNSTAC